MSKIFFIGKIIKDWFLKGTNILALSATKRIPFFLIKLDKDFTILSGSEQLQRVHVRKPTSNFYLFQIPQ